MFATSLADTNPFLFFLYLMFLFIFLMIFFQCIVDLFADHEESGVAKFLWCCAFIIALPLSTLVYLLVRGSGMAQRNLDRQKKANEQFVSMVQSAGGGSADQIAKAKELLDSGTITQAEFDAIKAKALS